MKALHEKKGSKTLRKGSGTLLAGFFLALDSTKKSIWAFSYRYSVFFSVLWIKYKNLKKKNTVTLKKDILNASLRMYYLKFTTKDQFIHGCCKN